MKMPKARAVGSWVYVERGGAGLGLGCQERKPNEAQYGGERGKETTSDCGSDERERIYRKKSGQPCLP